MSKTASQKPDARLFAKRRGGDARAMIFSGWTRPDGSVELRPEPAYGGRPGIAFIQLTDGTRVDGDWMFELVERKSRWP